MKGHVLLSLSLLGVRLRENGTTNVVRARPKLEKLNILSLNTRTNLAKSDGELDPQFPEVEPDHLSTPVHNNIEERAAVVRLIKQGASPITVPEKRVQRLAAIKCRAALCGRQESPRRGPRHTEPETVVKVEDGTSPPAANLSPAECKPKQCLLCLGNDRNSYVERDFAYATVNRMLDHTESHKQYPCDQHLPVACRNPVCKKQGFMAGCLEHFQNHVQRMHDQIAPLRLRNSIV